MSDIAWRQYLRDKQKKQLVKEGFIHIDDFGVETLTERGKQRTADRLDRLPVGDEYLIELAVLDAHGITAYS